MNQAQRQIKLRKDISALDQKLSGGVLAANRNSVLSLFDHESGDAPLGSEAVTKATKFRVLEATPMPYFPMGSLIIQGLTFDYVTSIVFPIGENALFVVQLKGPQEGSPNQPCFAVFMWEHRAENLIYFLTFLNISSLEDLTHTGSGIAWESTDLSDK